MKLLLERNDSKDIDFHTSFRGSTNIGRVAPVIQLLESFTRLPGDFYDIEDE
jgi:hypothetical protein